MLRDRNALYRLTGRASRERLHRAILNKSEREQRFHLEARGASLLTLLPE